MCNPDMSPSTLSSCCSFPWPSTTHSTTVVNLSLPIYFSFMSHYMSRYPQKKKKSFSGSLLLSLVCAHSPVSLQAQIKYLHACPLAQPLSHRHSAPFLCICKERYILERRFPSPHITLSTQWFLEQSQCTVQFHFLTVIERTPDTAWERKYRERNTQTVGLQNSHGSVCLNVSGLPFS